MSDSTLSLPTVLSPELNQAIVSGKVRGTVKFFNDRRSPRAIFTLVQRNGQRFCIKATQAGVIAVARGLSHDVEVMILGEFFPMEEPGVGVLAKTITKIFPPSTAMDSAKDVRSPVSE
jgi:hypothetical protein